VVVVVVEAIRFSAIPSQSPHALRGEMALADLPVSTS